MTSVSRQQLAAMIDHTLLAPEATGADVQALITEAVALQVYAVCVSPSMLPVTIPETLRVAAVCGFPSGKHDSRIKADEAALAARAGADEIDMVIDIGALRGGAHEVVDSELHAVRRAVPDVVLKVIIESAALSDDEIVLACRMAAAAGADFVKTSTGFHPAGGATVHAVHLMAQTVGDRLQVKASGGIRSYDDAVAMIEAGATRLGLSRSAEVLAGAP